MPFAIIRNRVYVRYLASGIEEGIVSTVALLSGVAIAGLSQSTILLTGTILLIVHAFSTAARSYFYLENSEENQIREAPQVTSIEGAAVTFISYLLASFIPLTPYIILDVSQAFTTAIVCSFSALYIVGLVSGRHGHRAWRNAARMAVVGGGAILIGAIAGSLLR